MNTRTYSKAAISVLMMWTLGVLPLSVLAQTRISMPKNKYDVQEDVKLGRDRCYQPSTNAFDVSLRLWVLQQRELP